ncbi:MBL fold metallo-hydrolase [Halopiger aswanensis]|uniref:Glyoxylase-like metal-dependent hydrolase (Beta-lactamase superfamily II) n=1 Tax=Halopiger aswanensis TaxID=148449 RepID=A0A3R7I042_9EURY|nr:MBL fold metallo-hydrolase [Halopiger aswanensis]RKD98150.1 glyoxylase-like metal-dependent hydrolase (beta-lactamase superfamily II) [Halopiger aswanensis]
MTMIAERVADGVHRCGSERVNWYLVEAADGLTVVDTGFPAHWDQFVDRLETIGYDVTDVDACLLTHPHPDHAGFAERLRREARVSVWLHEDDAAHARGDADVSLRKGVVRLWRPGFATYAVEFVRSGGLSVPPLRAFRTVTDGETLDVPGSPRVIHTPGHSEGHVAYHFPDHDALFCGDELVTTDFVADRGHRPQLLAEWFNPDHDRAYESLSRLESIGEVLLLPGHGEPWHGDTETAVELAREREKRK